MSGFTFNINEISNKDNKYYIGFWQNEKYFLDIEDIILKEFTLKNKMRNVSEVFQNQIIKNQSSVSLHVRRTDILDPKNKYGGICDLNYYDRAMSIIEEQIEKPTYFVFSIIFNKVIML